MSFEAEYRKLEEILGRLEGGELSLDESLAEYERGVAALRACRGLLERAERRIEELSPSDAPAPRGPEGGA